MPTKIKWERWEFPSKTTATKALRVVLRRYALKSKVIGADDVDLVGAAFANHPDFSSKVFGKKISHFEVHPNTGGSRCFYAVFDDGSKIDFSYKKAIDAAG